MFSKLPLPIQSAISLTITFVSMISVAYILYAISYIILTDEYYVEQETKCVSSNTVVVHESRKTVTTVICNKSETMYKCGIKNSNPSVYICATKEECNDKCEKERTRKN